ncbi:MAG: SWEET family sugar transporter [Candidatus Scalindua sp.]|nr:SWEET family sugar transporter [Candidatus Scalindua sp.]
MKNQNQTGVKKLQISNHKQQTNYKIQCSPAYRQTEMNKTSLFGILCLFIMICLLFGIYYLVLIRPTKSSGRVSYPPTILATLNFLIHQSSSQYKNKLDLKGELYRSIRDWDFRKYFGLETGLTTHKE